VMAKVLDSGEFDVVMCVLNFVDRFTYDFEGKVLPIARKHNVGVVAMKVMAAPQKSYGQPNPGRLADYADLAIRYSLSLPEVACAVVGVFPPMNSNKMSLLRKAESRSRSLSCKNSLPSARNSPRNGALTTVTQPKGAEIQASLRLRWQFLQGDRREVQVP